ncbi:NAD(P)-binding protein [Methylobacterium sp. UNC300MFChir4.1]|uniref:NAD(P)/FAD-dependent oxidoreductase n=1 Tax=Methylobacterium sp. UNC300MFChir4.1 TaxID=1502747 RepID=UPI00244ED559|nr:NAD(P)-binding protein [Methylobacterium sp. UNC300MFChir4.1]
MNEQGIVAVLGAGMAGAAAARRLAEAGFRVRVFDKGRGVGGRMATRRVGEMQFDHGAQFMRARGPAFAAELGRWTRLGIVAPWAGSDRHVGVPGMTEPVRALLSDLPVSSATTVVRLRRQGARWHLEDAAGIVHGPFDAVAITVPAPQVRTLLEASGVALPGVRRATYAPCWSLMVATETRPRDVLVQPRTDPIGLIAHDSAKPGRPAGSRLTVHATPAWSRGHLEAPREAVIAALLGAAEDVLGATLRPSHAEAHRWRYAQVETALEQPCLYDPDLRLGAGGDWSLGARIEAAYDSGQALARCLLADLGRPA